MWMVTKSEAVEIYARFFGSRHGSSASKLARKTANSLETRGDIDGHRAWNEVADMIDRHQQDRRGALHP